MAIPKQYFIIVVISSQSGYKRYVILDNNKNLSSVSRQHIKVFSLLLFPPTIQIKIHCADGRVCTQEYPSLTQSCHIIDNVCSEVFKLKHSIAYSLYRNYIAIRDPIPSTKAIVEYDPNLRDVWLFRKFWVRAMNTITDEPDINFNFSQARDIVFADKFPYKYYQWEDLIAISFIIEFKTSRNAHDMIRKNKVLIKKAKKEKHKRKKSLKHKNIEGTLDTEEEFNPVEIANINVFPVWMKADRNYKKKKKTCF